ncbi:hypothetical protein O181_033557 [Austropuccinia psidii MF-1]|uniref:Beta-xylanase n=1 Tax=Austropuccinia psidii MF-1 TaxID=1389203 RepID=A0A9Q3H7A3_9BASI|nr:hypothetical protein [Austropuccinia psidii MF-1]
MFRIRHLLPILVFLCVFSTLTLKTNADAKRYHHNVKRAGRRDCQSRSPKARGRVLSEQPGIPSQSGKKFVGTAITLPLLSDDKVVRLVTENFNMVTPGNVNSHSRDLIVDFCLKNGIKPRGHTAVWANQVPGWLKALDGPGLINATQNHLKQVLQHYNSKIYAFDVVNEMTGDDGKVKDTFSSQKLNSSFIQMAFQAARDTGTNAKLYINDFGVEKKCAKSDGYFKIVKELTEKNLINGVGMQAHLQVGQVPSVQELKENLQRFVALGVEVAYTELDIRMPLPATPQMLAQQAKDYRTVITACVETEKCVGVTVWGVGYQGQQDFLLAKFQKLKLILNCSDCVLFIQMPGSLDSWIPSFFPGTGAALLFDDDYKPTPAYDAFKEAFSGKKSVNGSNHISQ